MGRIWIRIKRSDPDLYQIEKLDPDPNQSGKPVPYQKVLDPQHWFGFSIFVGVPPSSTSRIGAQISPPSHQIDMVRNNT
jgi:hypothetical protein